MRSFFTYFLSGVIVVGMIAGCGRPKSTDDGSGPRDVSPKMMKQKTKGDKPEMDPSKMPPKPPPPAGGESKPQPKMPPKPPGT